MARSGFSAAEKFISEVEGPKLRPAYVLIGDEAFFRRQCRQAILEHLAPPESRDFAVYDFDLLETELTEVLDRARTPSLMAPFQVFFIRGVKALYGRGKNDDKLQAIEHYAKDPNPNAVLIFIADHISIPADVRRMNLQDRDRYQRIRDTLGEFCGMVELARVEEGDAVRWAMERAAAQSVALEPDAARELVDALGADMMMISAELEKIILYVGERRKITLGDIERMVLAAKQRSLYELTDAVSEKNPQRALEILDNLLSGGDGDEAAIGHLYMLAKTFRQMLVILEKNVRDDRAIWQALWQGFRVPPFAAADIIRQAKRYKSRREITRALRRIAAADLALRSSPPSKRVILEQLVLELASPVKLQNPAWQQEELPV